MLSADVVAAFPCLEQLRASVLSGQDIAAREILRGGLEQALPALGITRVGSLTELDRLGVPVWFAVRPESRSLCVSNGKGITDDAAWISAVMESAEQALAEQAGRIVAVVDSPAGMARRGLPVVPLDRQSRCAVHRIDADQELAWVKGISWATGHEIYAPFELVGMDMASSAPWNFGAFSVTSLGLASGADFVRAIWHGLSELVEDDAFFAPMTGRREAPIQESLLLSRQHQTLVGVLDSLAQNDVEARFVDLTDDITVPTVAAALCPANKNCTELAYFSGRSCRPTLEDAALAALLEAAQTRLTFISGSRDDLLAAEYTRPLKGGTRELFGAYALADRAIEPFDVTKALHELVGKVLALGVDVYVFPLGGSNMGIEVVRVLADDLLSMEGPVDQARSGRAADKLLRMWGHPA